MNFDINENDALNTMAKQAVKQAIKAEKDHTERLTKDDKDAFLKQFKEFWDFERDFHPEYKKLWGDKTEFDKADTKIINLIIGNAARDLGLDWDWIGDETYLFGFYEKNGSPKNMTVKVPYDFTFPSLRTKLLSWFRKKCEKALAAEPGKPQIKVTEAFRAGNRARKKESAQDMANNTDIPMIVPSDDESCEKAADRLDVIFPKIAGSIAGGCPIKPFRWDYGISFTIADSDKVISSGRSNGNSIFIKYVFNPSDHDKFVYADLSLILSHSHVMSLTIALPIGDCNRMNLAMYDLLRMLIPYLNPEYSRIKELMTPEAQKFCDAAGKEMDADGEFWKNYNRSCSNTTAVRTALLADFLNSELPESVREFVNLLAGYKAGFTMGDIELCIIGIARGFREGLSPEESVKKVKDEQTTPLHEAFRAGNRARKKESVRDTAVLDMMAWPRMPSFGPYTPIEEVKAGVNEYVDSIGEEFGRVKTTLATEMSAFGFRDRVWHLMSFAKPGRIDRFIVCIEYDKSRDNGWRPGISVKLSENFDYFTEWSAPAEYSDEDAARVCTEILFNIITAKGRINTATTIVEDEDRSWRMYQLDNTFRQKYYRRYTGSSSKIIPAKFGSVFPIHAAIAFLDDILPQECVLRLDKIVSDIMDSIDDNLIDMIKAELLPMEYINEAFRAGNRARKKESAQDTAGGDISGFPPITDEMRQGSGYAFSEWFRIACPDAQKIYASYAGSGTMHLDILRIAKDERMSMTIVTRRSFRKTENDDWFVDKILLRIDNGRKPSRGGAFLVKPADYENISLWEMPMEDACALAAVAFTRFTQDLYEESARIWGEIHDSNWLVGKVSETVRVKFGLKPRQVPKVFIPWTFAMEYVLDRRGGEYYRVFTTPEMMGRLIDDTGSWSVRIENVWPGLRKEIIPLLQEKGVIDNTVDEAFRAGNRARKKESVQDAVESVDNIQAQIDRFKEQTGIELEIRDGRPYVDGSLWLEGCTGLTSLPAGLKVGGDLFLRGCTGLTNLPNGLKVGGRLLLRGCTGLTSLPACLEVGEYLDLRDCTGLTSLPAGLEVGGYLDLRGCTGLTSLPYRLKVRKNLYLTDCTGLTGLPTDLVVQGNLIIHGGVLTPFFKKLGIPVDRNGDTNARDWFEWQKAHGYLTEAFRAGNKARKKESVQDAAGDNIGKAGFPEELVLTFDEFKSLGHLYQPRINEFRDDIIKWVNETYGDRLKASPKFPGSDLTNITLWNDRDRVDFTVKVNAAKEMIYLDLFRYEHDCHVNSEVCKWCLLSAGMMPCDSEGWYIYGNIRDQIDSIVRLALALTDPEFSARINAIPDFIHNNGKFRKDLIRTVEGCHKDNKCGVRPEDFGDREKGLTTIVLGPVMDTVVSDVTLKYGFDIVIEHHWHIQDHRDAVRDLLRNTPGFPGYNGNVSEAFKAGNRARKHERIEDTVEEMMTPEMYYPPVETYNPVTVVKNLQRSLMQFTDGEVGISVADERCCNAWIPYTGGFTDIEVLFLNEPENSGSPWCCRIRIKPTERLGYRGTITFVNDRLWDSCDSGDVPDDAGKTCGDFLVYLLSKKDFTLTLIQNAKNYLLNNRILDCPDPFIMSTVMAGWERIVPPGWRIENLHYLTNYKYADRCRALSGEETGVNEAWRAQRKAIKELPQDYINEARVRQSINAVIDRLAEDLWKDVTIELDTPENDGNPDPEAEPVTIVKRKVNIPELFERIKDGLNEFGDFDVDPELRPDVVGEYAVITTGGMPYAQVGGSCGIPAHVLGQYEATSLVIFKDLVYEFAKTLTNDDPSKMQEFIKALNTKADDLFW